MGACCAFRLPGAPPFYAVLHGYQHYDINMELLGSLGQYPVPAGYSADAYRAGYKGDIYGASLYTDGLIAVDSTPDVRGAVFAKRANILVQGKSPWTSKRYEPQKGYGGWNVWLKDEYVWAERSPGNWAYAILSDGTAPTS